MSQYAEIQSLAANATFVQRGSSSSMGREIHPTSHGRYSWRGYPPPSMGGEYAANVEATVIYGMDQVAIPINMMCNVVEEELGMAAPGIGSFEDTICALIQQSCSKTL